MRLLHPATPGQLNFGLAILRGIIGLIFIAHGGQKLFVFGPAGVTDAFSGMGIPLAAVAAPAVALLEFFGGFALVAGLLTRVVAAGLALTMLAALFLVHLSAGFFLPDGFEFVLALFGATATLVLTGGGAWSLDALLSRRSTRADTEVPRIRRAA